MAIALFSNYTFKIYQNKMMIPDIIKPYHTANQLIHSLILIEPEQHKVLVEIARREKRSLSDLVREMIDQQLKERKRKSLEVAAEALLDDYQNDTDLSGFKTLDGEDFHA